MDIILAVILTLLAVLWTIVYGKGCVEHTSMISFCLSLLWTSIFFLWIILLNNPFTL